MKHLKEKLEARQVGTYFIAIALGALTGSVFPQSAAFEAAINPALVLMLFATFMQVPLAAIRVALRNTSFMAALVVTNFVLLPLIVAGLISFAPDEPMLRFAILLVLLAPCIDYVITFTHLGGGDARQLLAMTPVLLALQMLLLPLYLGLLLGADAGSLIQAGPFVQAFIWLIALPLLAAGLLQTASKKNARTAHGVEAIGLLPVPATALVLFIVMAAVMPQIDQARQAALQAAPVYIAFSLIAPCLGWLVSRTLKLEAASARAVSFSASYRNSLVILPLAFAIPGGTPLIPAVILTQTITELLFLPVYLKWIPNLPQRPQPATVPPR